jgi:iron(III) transport system permease protein
VAVFVQVKALGVGLRQYAVISGRGYRRAPIPLGRLRYVVFVIAAVYAFLAGILPMLTLLYQSLIPEFTAGLHGLSLDIYVHDIFGNPRTVQAILNTVLYAALAATLSAVLATVSAWLISRSAVRGRIALEYLCMVPSAVPHVVLAIGYLWAFVRTPIYGTMWILILGYAAGFVPFALRAIQPAMLQVDKSLEEAGQMSGLGWFRSMRSIMIPLIRASLASSWLLLFLLTIRELPVSLMLYTEGTQVYSVVLFNAWHAGLYHQAAAIATTQTILMVAVIALVRLVGGRGRTMEGLM